MTTMGNKIRELRNEKKLSQMKLGKLAGVSKSTVSQWENGKIKEISGAHLLKLADALGVNASWITTNNRFATIQDEAAQYRPQARPEDETDLLNEYQKLNKADRKRAIFIIKALYQAHNEEN